MPVMIHPHKIDVGSRKAWMLRIRGENLGFTLGGSLGIKD